MYKVVEMPTATVLESFSSINDALAYIENIESSTFYDELFATYGSVRRVQQELTVEAE
jgi:hypothetical protein